MRSWQVLLALFTCMLTGCEHPRPVYPPVFTRTTPEEVGAAPQAPVQRAPLPQPYQRR